jgi:prolyl oligopeptidase
MRQKLHIFAALCVLASFATVLVGAQAPRAAVVPGAPKTAAHEVKETIQGVEISDPYRWLEDQNSPETRAWIDEQNAYTDSLLSQVPRRDALRQKVSALLKIETMSAPHGA